MLILTPAGDRSRATFVGQVGNDGTSEVEIGPGWSLLGLSEGRPIPVQDAFASCSVGAPVGGSSESAADQIVTWDETGRGHWLMFVQGWGAPYDGHWVDLMDFRVSPLVIRPGLAFYYFRQESGGVMRVNF
jgi:hypothetical protein